MHTYQILSYKPDKSPAVCSLDDQAFIGLLSTRGQLSGYELNLIELPSNQKVSLAVYGLRIWGLRRYWGFTKFDEQFQLGKIGGVWIIQARFPLEY